MKKVNFISIPFKIETEHGLTSGDGIAKISSAGIVLEFEMKIIGLVKTGAKDVRLPLEEILSVNFKKGFFKYGTKIEIRMQSFLKLSEVPNKDGKIILKIPRDQHEQAKEAVEILTKNLNAYVQSLPPPQMPVHSLFEPEDLTTNKLDDN
jgi:hypothetical protein